jgi:hypothetical protein
MELLANIAKTLIASYIQKPHTNVTTNDVRKGASLTDKGDAEAYFSSERRTTKVA